jgi:TPP-dependent pyruvate/acetoin dehydrogenase alpha subunit
MPENGLQQLLADRSSLWRIRHFEERVQELRSVGGSTDSVHLCNGQEAIYVAACSASDLRRDSRLPDLSWPWVGDRMRRALGGRPT